LWKRDGGPGSASGAAPGGIRTLAPLDVEFYLYFPQEDDAEKAAETLRAEGYAVVARLGADEKNWLALASQEVSDEGLGAAEERMEQLAGSFGGEYDGYERPV
jgi:hypothetical protein